MDQPGPGGTAIFDQPIIEAPERRPRAARVTDWVLTVLLWEMYIYLMSDVAVVAAAWLGFVEIEDYGLSWDGVAALFETLGLYALGTAASGAVLIGWALYNQFRFRGVERRKAPAPLTVHDLAALHAQPPTRVLEWQHARRLVMHHAADGSLRAVDASHVVEGSPRRPELPTPPLHGRRPSG